MNNYILDTVISAYKALMTVKIRARIMGSGQPDVTQNVTQLVAPAAIYGAEIL